MEGKYQITSRIVLLGITGMLLVFSGCDTPANGNWIDQTRTGTWWETAANWMADTFMNYQVQIIGAVPTR